MAGKWKLDLGASTIGSDRVRFKVWAPAARKVSVELVDQDRTVIPMQPSLQGYFEVTAEGVGPRVRYRYLLDGKRARPDPASRFQPEGVHAPSAVVDPEAFQWTDKAWRGMPLKDFIIYELHVGTFTREGTFEAIIPYLSYLKNEVGFTAIELMPVAQFPGRRNWGYDGVHPFAPQSTYGGPEGLKSLVDACHATGLAVILDVVYNHLGPEGNYLGEFGPYFTDRYRTPWGSAINYDGPDSDAVRQYVVGNALYWVTEYHIDTLRLDAIHSIYDFSATHILKELSSAVHAQAVRLNRQVLVIAESDLNDARALVLLSPNIPLLFMGEEYGETAPFQYFIEHGDPALIEAVRQGRQREFAHFGWKQEEIPDPQDHSTFERCRLNREGLESRQAGLLRWTSALISLRKTTTTLGAGDRETSHHSVRALEREQVLIVHRWSNQGDMSLLLLGFNQAPITLTLCEPGGNLAAATEFGVRGIRWTGGGGTAATAGRPFRGNVGDDSALQRGGIRVDTVKDRM